MALAASLKADECQIYTDVDGVYTTDPRICPKARRLDLALDFWDQLHEQGLKPNTVLYNSIISACEKGRDLMRALNILSNMYQDEVPRDVITYNSVISACEKAGNHEKALYFLNKMYAIDGIYPDTVSYNSALSAASARERYR